MTISLHYHDTYANLCRVGSAITFFPRDEHQDWFEAALAEVEEI